MTENFAALVTPTTLWHHSKSLINENEWAFFQGFWFYEIMRLLQLKFLYYSRLCDVVKIVVKVVSTLYIFIRYSMRLKIFTVLNNPRRTAKLFQVKVQLNFRDIWRLAVHNWLTYASLILMQCLRAQLQHSTPLPAKIFMT